MAIPYESELRDKALELNNILDTASCELYYMARFLCKTEDPFLVAELIKIQRDVERQQRLIKRLLESKV